SSIAFFSEHAISALCEKLGHEKLKHLINTLEADGQRRLQAAIQSDEPVNDLQEPSLELQMQYVRSYFEQISPIYPFLDQDHFEQKAFSLQDNSLDPLHKPWLALYYAILSLGCLYHEGGSFNSGKGLAWRYFQISFSYFADVLISKPSLLKAQAIFALNYSSLQLETLCVTEAARAVITLGLHKKTLDLESDIEGRRTFWVVYCIEKEYAFNSTLASFISDGDIGCPLPSAQHSLLEGFDWLHCWAWFSRILSRTYDTLFSITATLNTEDDYLSYLACINHDLNAWRQSVPEIFRPEVPIRQHRMRHPVMKELALRSHLAYYNLRICLSRLTIHVTHDKGSQRRSEAKRDLMLAARSIVELMQFCALEPYSPVWNIGCMPLVAMFILFDFVVQNPSHHETRTNISYLDIVAAHFARLDLASQGAIRGLTVAEFAAVAKQFVNERVGNREEEIYPPAVGLSTRILPRPSPGGQEIAGADVNENANEQNFSFDENFSGSIVDDALEFPEESNSLYMTLQHPGFDMADIFGQTFL
ncbi:uncharacterized protein A1O5_12652, partial [Cladophialophora psammophila CBS 110553]